MITFALAAFSLAAAAAPLRSPWDAPITPTSKPYACPAVAHLSPNVEAVSRYVKGDPTHSVVDPALDARNIELTRPFYESKKITTDAADNFRTTGSSAAAQCAITQIVTFAHDNAMNGNVPPGQPVYVQGWIAGTHAIAWLKVKQLATAEQQQAVSHWLLSIAQHQRDYYDPRGNKNDGTNNHSYWAGFDVAAIGLAAQDEKNFQWGLRYYNRGVNDIQPNGSLPKEVDRAARALGYHYFAITPLIMLAELGEANGLPLYERNHGAIHRLAAFCVAAWNDPTILQKMNGKPQEKKDHLTAGEVAWMVPYLTRFPNHPEMQAMLAQVKKTSFDTIGGLPPKP